MKYIAKAVWAARTVGKISSILLKYSTFAVFFMDKKNTKIGVLDFLAFALKI